MILIIVFATLIAAPFLGLGLGVALGLGTSLSEVLYLANPVNVLLLVAAAYAFLSFVLAVITKDYSQTDRLWSTAPIVYALLVIIANPADPRVWFMGILVILWGIRLTYNFARRGGFTSIEDYRWEVLRKRITNKFAWQAFNFGFIAFYQHALIVGFVLPLAVVAKSGKALGWEDFLVGGLFLLSLALETVADQQMWNFQERKRNALEAGKPAPEGNFIKTGLWRYSRHPNVFFESLNWVIFYFFVPVALGVWFHWSFAGAFLLITLLQGSIAFTEGISISKYPEFKEHKKLVSSYVPWFTKLPRAK